MSNVLKTGFKNAIKYIVYFVVAVQLVLAVLWIVKNISAFNEDYMAYNYIKAADTLVVDDYMGILYALIVRLLGHGWILYLFQLALVAFFAWFMGGVWCMGLVATNPFVLQCCFCCLPNALILACFLATAGLVKKSRKWSELLWTLIPQTAIGLLNPDYAFISALCMAGIVIYKILGRQRSGYVLLATMAFSFALSFGINGLVSTPGAYGRAEKTIEFLKMQRLSWPNIQREYLSLEEYHNLEFKAQGVESSKVAEKLSTVFGYELERKLGKELTEAYFGYMTQKAVSHGPRAYLTPIVKDEIGYLFAPANCLYTLTFKSPEPIFAKENYLFERNGYYVFSFYYFFSLISAVVLGLAGIFKSLAKNRKNLAVFLWIAIWCSLYATLVCTRGFDYRNVCVIMAGWPLLILSKNKVCEE